MKVCVIQPDYGTSAVDYKNYDPRRNLRHLLPDAQVDHVFLNKISTYAQLKALKKQGYDIFVNLCEAYLEWDIPSIDVIHALDLLNLPYTGPNVLLYDPPKPLMKYVAYTVGVDTPDFAVVTDEEDALTACAHLTYPVFVKPAKAGDSLGIDAGALVQSPGELPAQVRAVLEQYEEVLVESFIPGREFTVLVVADPEPGMPARAFLPLEFVFPEGNTFKTYDLKITQWHPELNVPCTDPALDRRLREAACRVFEGFEGVGYARLDFRVDAAGNIFFLEINFACSVFYPAGYEGSADYILQYDGIGQSGFLQCIIEEGTARYRRNQKKYALRGNTTSGFGICAARALAKGEVIWKGEERSQRIVTRAWVEAHWPASARETFRRYAYPLCDTVFVLWDNNPAEWAPMNHSCEPNSGYSGLNVVALRNIPAGEELTLDYATFLNEHAEPFNCRCGSPNCRGVIRGVPGNTVDARENP